MAPPRYTYEDFWAQVDVSAPEKCWEWRSHVNACGYGKVTWHGKSYTVHRLSAWFSGIIKNIYSLEHILHECDNRRCCNPDHLFAGTTQENTRDKVNKGRQAKGAKQHLAKLTDSQITEIRSKYVPYKTSLRVVGEQYGVGISTIHAIVKNQTWKHVE